MHRRVVVVSTYHLAAQYDPIAFIGRSKSQGSGLYRRTTSRYFDILRVKCTTADIARIEHMLDSIILTIIYVEKLRMDKELKEMNSKEKRRKSGWSP